jgi:hypothetical protein
MSRIATSTGKRLALITAVMAVVAASVALHIGTADAATALCAGTQVGTRPINGDDEQIGELVVYKSATDKWCVLAYHRGSTVGVALPTSVQVTAPTGSTVLDSGSFQEYAGPANITTTTCATGTAPCWYVTGSITQGGTKRTSLPFYLVDSATDANPCGGTQVGATSIKAGSTVIGEVVSYRISATMYCGVTYHRGPTAGVASYTELGVGTPEGKGLVDSGTFKYNAGPAQVWDATRYCPAGAVTSCYQWIGGITYGGTLYVEQVAFQP